MSFIKKWGSIVGFVGVILGILIAGFSIWDRFALPRLDYCEVMPVCVDAGASASDSRTRLLGISAIVHCRAKDKTVFVSALDFLGKKYLSADEYIPEIDNKTKGMSFKEIKTQVDREKPFERVNWSGWPRDQSAAVRLEPHEEKYVRFEFLYPTEFFYAQYSGPPYIGSERLKEEPERVRTRPSLFDIFNFQKRIEDDYLYLTPTGLRDELASGYLRFEVRVGGAQMLVPKNQVTGFRIIKAEDWNQKTAQELFDLSHHGFRNNPLKTH